MEENKKFPKTVQSDPDLSTHHLLRANGNVCDGASCPFCHASGLSCGGAGIQSGRGRGRVREDRSLRPPLPNIQGKSWGGGGFWSCLGVPAPETGAEDQQLCLTSSTCRNSRKSRIRSDSRVICSKAESHTKRSRTLNGRALLIRPAPARHGCRQSTGQGWGGGRKGAGAGPAVL